MLDDSITNELPVFTDFDAETFPDVLKRQLQEGLETLNAILEANEPPFKWDNLMRPMENMEDKLEKLWAPFSHLHSATDSEEYRRCYEKCIPELIAYESAIAQNESLYEAVKSISRFSLDSVQAKIIENSLRDFKLYGVALEPQQKKRFEAIQRRLSELSNQFETNILDAENHFELLITDEETLKGIPEHTLNEALELAEKKGKQGWLFNLQYPVYNAVITYAENRELREKMYTAYITKASEQGPDEGKYDNSATMDEILALRHEKALLLGFNNYAEYSLASKMAESTDEVMDFLIDLCERAHRQAELEYSRLHTFAEQYYMITDMQPWDIAFFSEKRKQKLFKFSEEELRPYFTLDKVIEGLFTIVNRLYSIRLKEVKPVDVWHPDVKCYAVLGDDGSRRGYIYMDLYARASKRGGAWMDALQSRRKRDNGSIQLPVATLTCNFSKPTEGKKSTLTHDEIVTTFHEFGHCLHHVLTRIDYLEASGIHGVEWDAVEFPSQFFENWCWEPSALSLLSAHENTGEPLPYEMFDRLIAAKNFQSAMALLRQLELSLFDFRIHLEYEPGKKNFIMDTLNDVRKKTCVSNVCPFNRFAHSFSHIFGGGYAAGYYSYKWAEILSSDAYERFEKEGIFNVNTGHDFLHFVLETGGSVNAMDAYIGFRGRKASVDALLKHSGIK